MAEEEISEMRDKLDKQEEEFEKYISPYLATAKSARYWRTSWRRSPPRRKRKSEN